MLVGIAIAAIAFLVFGLLIGGVVVGLFLGLVGFGIGFLIPEFWLGRRIKARQKLILKMIPDTLDLLTISVRAGLGFDGALAKVVEKLPGPLTDEFPSSAGRVRVGKARRDALRDMVPRPRPAALQLHCAIIQAEQLGVSISKVLQVQSEQLRIERRQRAEEQQPERRSRCCFRWWDASSRRSSSSSSARPSSRSSRRWGPARSRESPAIDGAQRQQRDPAGRAPRRRRFFLGQVHGLDGAGAATGRRWALGCRERMASTCCS